MVLPLENQLFQNSLTAYGFKIVDADIASREAVKKGSKGLEQVKEILGKKQLTKMVR